MSAVPSAGPEVLAGSYDPAAVFRAAFDASPDGLLIIGHDGRIVMASQCTVELLGYPLAELIGLSIESLVPEDTRARHAAYRGAYNEHPRTRLMGTRSDLVARRKNGSEVQIEIALSPLHTQGMPLTLAAIRGISEYPRVKRALLQARYSECVASVGQLAVNARDPQVIIAELPRIIATALEVDVAMVFLLERDRAWLRVASGVGMIESEQIGALLPFQPDTSPGLVLAQGSPLVIADYRTEQRFVVAAPYLEAGLLSAMAVPISDRGRIIGALTVRTRQLRTFGEDEVRFLQATASVLATSLQRANSEEALSHAERLESVGQLTGGIAHDFNNLLTVIQGNLQVLDELPSDAQQLERKPLLDAAMRATRRAAELTTKLLAFSRRQVLQPVSIPSNAMLESMVELLRRTLDQRIVIDLELEDDCPSVRADQALLESALLNIAINARDAMPDGGVLHLKATHRAEIPESIREELLMHQAPFGYVAIRISDTGVGMSDEVKERAFEPFYTTKEAGRGTGLGLSTVYGFITQSKGAVTIDTAPGSGTSITLFVPAAGATDDLPAAGPTTPSGDLKGVSLLLIEDDPEVQRIARRFAEDAGCRVVAASSAEAGLQLIESGMRFDILLTDIALGAGMRGTEMASRAQAFDATIGIVLTSGYSTELIEADELAPPGWELLAKPYSREVFAGALGRAAALRRQATL
ncbi:hypothetical protein BH10PSE17_BH10PSE17_14300 [soil metagenome]